MTPTPIACPPAIREFLDRLGRNWLPTRAQRQAVQAEIAALLADRAELHDLRRRALADAAALELARVNSWGHGRGAAPENAVRELVDAVCPLSGVIAERERPAPWIDDVAVDRATAGEDVGRALTPAERAAAAAKLAEQGLSPTAIEDRLRIQSYNEQIRRRGAA